MSSVHDKFDAAVVIGRFQPFHNGHHELIEHALSVAPRTIVVLGSAHSARSPKNPWTHTEREAVIRASFPDADLTFLPVRDYYDETRWRTEVLRLVGHHLSAISSPRVALVGHFKDTSSHYLAGFHSWRLIARDMVKSIHATSIRDGYFSAESSSVSKYVASIEAAVPKSTLDLLSHFGAGPIYSELADEWRALRQYRALWANTPFTPIFVTSDALVTCANRVVLVQRGKAPGRGLWALPGGFIEPHETTLQSARRELAEETQLWLPPEASQPIASHVFDHPARSQRGRTISHAFHFSLNAIPCPELTAADDAADARWVPIEKLGSMEEQLFDDHFHILDTFLRLL